MLLHSPEFALFFAIVYALYLLASHRWQNRLLLAASYFFYVYWDYRYIALILVSTVVNFLCGRAIFQAQDQRNKKRLVLISTVVNLSLLGFFKYFNFFIESANAVLAGWGVSVASLNIILPVGISFYTFQSMSYTVDIFRGRLVPAKRFSDFALFVAFFPQLVAGPIERATRFLPQIVTPRHLSRIQIHEGIYLILWGVFKKVYVADNLQLLVDFVFQNQAGLPGLVNALGVVAYAFQIYADFSGYSNMARGLAKLMGFELMRNFELPYFATNPSDFWKRWHISLSTWLRDYLYIPLGGNRKGAWRTGLNLMITMVLGGLWHGAAWTFVLWGFLHGLLLMIHRFLRQRISWFKSGMPRLIKVASITLMFALVCLGWLFFRASSMQQAMSMLDRMWNHFSWLDMIVYVRMVIYVVYFVAPIIVLQLMQYNVGDMLVVTRVRPFWRGCFYFVVLALLLSSGLTGGKTFIYFQF